MALNYMMDVAGLVALLIKRCYWFILTSLNEGSIMTLWSVTKTDLKTGEVVRTVFDDATDGSLEDALNELKEQNPDQHVFADTFLHDQHLPGNVLDGPQVNELIAQKAKDNFVAPAEKATEDDVVRPVEGAEPSSVGQLDASNVEAKQTPVA
jgi:hypothetical protein